MTHIWQGDDNTQSNLQSTDLAKDGLGNHHADSKKDVSKPILGSSAALKPNPADPAQVVHKNPRNPMSMDPHRPESAAAMEQQHAMSKAAQSIADRIQKIVLKRKLFYSLKKSFDRFKFDQNYVRNQNNFRWIKILFLLFSSPENPKNIFRSNAPEGSWMKTHADQMRIVVEQPHPDDEKQKICSPIEGWRI